MASEKSAGGELLVKSSIAAAAALILWGVLRTALTGFAWADAFSIAFAAAAGLDAILSARANQALSVRTTWTLWGASVFVLLSDRADCQASVWWVLVFSLTLLFTRGRVAGLVAMGLGLAGAAGVGFLHAPVAVSTDTFGGKLLFLTTTVTAFGYLVSVVTSLLTDASDANTLALTRARSTSISASAKNQHLLHMNHELRTPLTAIVGAVGLLYNDKTGWNTDDSRKELLVQTIASTSRHALAIVNDVLDVERLESGVAVSPKAPFSIRGVIRQAIAMSESQATAVKSRLRMRVGGELPDAWVGPETRVAQVLLNLIANAIKYAPGSDVIVAAYSSGGRLVLEISDKGPGMSASVQSKLFEAYASSAGASGSTGLGLRICKLIVEVEMRGTIQVSTQPGQGTAFTISLPLEQVESSKTEQKATALTLPNSEPPEFNQLADTLGSFKHRLYGKRILVVEDDATSNAIMAMVLEDAGLTVVSAESSQEALEKVATHPPFDIAMLDHNLGTGSKVDGVQLAGLLKQAGIPRLVGHSGNYSKETEKEWFAAGIQGIIRKPIPLDEVLRKLAEALEV